MCWSQRHGRRRPPTFFWVSTLLWFCLGCVVSVSGCPWDQSGLLPWSQASTWSQGAVPPNGSAVLIDNGAKVLLDVSVTLAALVIHTDAELIWANLPNLELRTGLMLIGGSFHLGSTSCRFTKPAFIRFIGKSDRRCMYHPKMNDDTMRHPDSWKCLEVQAGGTLEIHGQKKTSWTRLAQSLPILSDVPCAVVYDHSKNPFGEERNKGLHVIVWNQEGSVFDYGVFDVFTSLHPFIASVPDGKVIGMYAFGTNGVDDRKNKKLDFETLDKVVEQLGGRLIFQVTKKDSYSLLTRKGSPSSTIEYYKYGGRVDTDQQQNFLQLPVWETKLAFQVATSALTSFQYFRVLQADFALPILELADEVIGWSPGDKIVVASTDFDWDQAEVREIVPCKECSPSQIRVNESFRYRHYGNFTYGVDERAEVGMLTRNILIEGVTEKQCYFTNSLEKKLCNRFGEDTYGGHIRILHGFKAAHVQGVELYHMGQQAEKGSYPLHFHLVDDAKGSWLRDNSIHDSFSRCVTVHGTDYLEVSGHVCYRHLGHGYFLEDSVEQNNVIKGNLGLSTLFGTLLMSDSTKDWCKEDYTKKDFTINCAEVSTFWLTHPNNDISGNVAAGGVCHGFMFVFADAPLGPSFELQKKIGKVTFYHAKSYPIKRFYNNVAHSNYRSGIFTDSYISSGGRVARDLDVPENGIVQEENEYEPRYPPGDINGTRVWTKMERVTSYKNKQNNMWVKAGNINITFTSMADPASQSFSGGCTGFQTGSSLEYSIVIGRSDNLGSPTQWIERLKNNKMLKMTFNRSVGRSPWQTITGVGIYQGPMYVKHSYFDRFQTVYWNDAWTSQLGKRPVSHAGAISFKKDSTYPTYTSQYITNLTFGFCDNVDNKHYVFCGTHDMYDWTNRDGPKNIMTYDRDGSVTGTPNTIIMRTRPFFLGRGCIDRPDWGLSVCPQRYVKVEVKGSGGSLDKNLHDQWALVGRRDDVPKDPFFQKAQQRMEYLTRIYTSYIIGFNTSLKGAAFADEMKVFGYGMEKQDMVRVGLCIPKEMKTFNVLSDYPVIIKRNNYTRVNSLRELDEAPNGANIYHDQKNGMIFFKLWSRYDRTNDSQLCSAGVCPMIKFIFPKGHTLGARDCFKVDVPPYVDNRPPAAQLPVKHMCSKGSLEGIGAIRWEEVSKIVHREFSLPCLKTPTVSVGGGRNKPSLVDCFVESTQTFQLTHDYFKSLTVDMCVKRCYQRRFKFAGLGKRTCSCSNSFVNTELAKNLKGNVCNSPCPGSLQDSQKSCGNTNRMAIWNTGI